MPFYSHFTEEKTGEKETRTLAVRCQSLHCHWELLCSVTGAGGNPVSLPRVLGFVLFIVQRSGRAANVWRTVGPTPLRPSVCLSQL